ncbi:MAG: aldo/keto reductase [Bacteroidota bacterium]
MQVPLLPLSPAGPKISRLVAGTMNWGVWGANYSPTEVARLLEGCLEMGMSSIDLADIYGHYTTESLVGAGLKELGADREKFQLISKCGIKLVTENRPDYRLKSYDLSKAHILYSVDNSLQELGTDYLDVLLLHRPDPLMDVREVAEAFALLKESGKVQHFGVSNFTPSQFTLLQSVTPLVTNQLQCSPLHLDPIFDGCFDQLQQQRCRPMIWAPLGGGEYFSRATSRVLRLRTAVKEVSKRLGDVGEDVTLLAWAMQHPVGVCPILGTTKLSRLREARLALDCELDRQDWFSILEAARNEEVA